jgi:hypothetical protein
LTTAGKSSIDLAVKHMGRNILCWKRIQVFVKDSPDAVPRTALLALSKGGGDVAYEEE